MKHIYTAYFTIDHIPIYIQVLIYMSSSQILHSLRLRLCSLLLILSWRIIIRSVLPLPQEAFYSIIPRPPRRCYCALANCVSYIGVPLRTILHVLLPKLPPPIQVQHAPDECCSDDCHGKHAIRHENRFGFSSPFLLCLSPRLPVLPVGIPRRAIRFVPPHFIPFVHACWGRGVSIAPAEPVDIIELALGWVGQKVVSGYYESVPF